MTAQEYIKHRRLLASTIFNSLLGVSFTLKDVEINELADTIAADQKKTSDLAFAPRPFDGTVHLPEGATFNPTPSTDAAALDGNRPPLGLMPSAIARRRFSLGRVEEIRLAINRYREASKPAPAQWIDELVAHEVFLAKEYGDDAI